ncbi:hypothetical protein DFJ73DRAFT_796375 [Zopfochytrium polystomum]|nr:hypothetical protein DFJ73DRAFT_796375 [Zopfochytrium polystomum]
MGQKQSSSTSNKHTSSSRASAVFLVALPLLSWATTASAASTFEKPNGFGVKYRYWVEDARADPTVVASDLANMAASGASGVEFLLFQNYGKPTVEDPSQFNYGSANFNTLLDKTAQAAVANKLTVDLCAGPAQGAGIPAFNPDQEGFNTELAFGFTLLKADQGFDGPLPPPVIVSLQSFGVVSNSYNVTTSRLEGVILAELDHAANTSAADVSIVFSTVKDLTNNVSSGRLTIPAPTSNSVIIAFYSRRNGYQEAYGANNGSNPADVGTWASYTVDHFSPVGARIINDFNERHLFSPVPSAFRKAGSLIWQDSHEFRAQLHWTSNFSARFVQMHGYKPLIGMPAFYSRFEAGIGSVNFPPQLFRYSDDTVNARFSLDYQETLTAMYLDYITERRAGIEKLGFQHSMQPGYNFPLDASAAAALCGVPEIESLGVPTIEIAKQVAGGVHLGIKKIFSTELGAAELQAYGQFWSGIIQLANIQYAAGVNQVVLHGFPYSGLSAQTTWPGLTTFQYLFSEMHGPRTPAFSLYSPYLTVLARSNYVLQKGNTGKMDVAILRTQTDIDLVPAYNPTGYIPPPPFNSDVLRAAGFSFDYVSHFNFELPTSTVSNRRLSPTGPAYKVLILNFQPNVTVATAQRILQYGIAGLPIILVGNTPSDIPGYEVGSAKKSAVQAAMQKLVKLSNVKVVPDYSGVPAALQSLDVTPATAFHTPAPNTFSVRRTEHSGSETTDYYWLFNSGTTAVTMDVSFETAARNAKPFVMDVWSGAITPAAVFTRPAGNSVTINVSLNPGSTTVFAFTSSSTCEGASAASPVHLTSVSNATAVTANSKTIELRAAKSGDISVSVAGEASNRTIKAQFPMGAPTSAIVPTNWTLTLTTWAAPKDITGYASVIATHHPVQLSTLAAWASIPQFANTSSGVGLYETTFDWPASPADVGATLDATATTTGFTHVATVTLNDVVLPPVDPTTLLLDLPQTALRLGRNTLTIRVASTLLNALNQVDPNTILTFGKSRNEVLQQAVLAQPDQQTGLVGTVKITPYIRTLLVV